MWGRAQRRLTSCRTRRSLPGHLHPHPHLSRARAPAPARTRTRTHRRPTEPSILRCRSPRRCMQWGSTRAPWTSMHMLGMHGRVPLPSRSRTSSSPSARDSMTGPPACSTVPSRRRRPSTSAILSPPPPPPSPSPQAHPRCVCGRGRGGLIHFDIGRRVWSRHLHPRVPGDCKLAMQSLLPIIPATAQA